MRLYQALLSKMKLETMACKGLKRILEVTALKYGNLSHFFQNYTILRESEKQV